MRPTRLRRLNVEKLTRPAVCCATCAASHPTAWAHHARVCDEGWSSPQWDAPGIVTDTHVCIGWQKSSEECQQVSRRRAPQLTGPRRRACRRNGWIRGKDSPRFQPSMHGKWWEKWWERGLSWSHGQSKTCRADVVQDRKALARILQMPEDALRGDVHVTVVVQRYDGTTYLPNGGTRWRDEERRSR